MSLPYFAFYPKDFVAKTSHLTTAQEGVYIRLLNLMWMTPECRVPDNPTWLMRRLRVDKDEYEQNVLVIIDDFCMRSKGFIFNKRLREEWVKASDLHAKRVEAGSKGGKANGRKYMVSDASNAKAKQEQPEPQPDPDPDPDFAGGGTCDAETFREKILVAMGHDPSGMTANGQQVGGYAEMQWVTQTMSDLDLSEADTLGVVADVMAGKRDGPPSSFRYFSPALQRYAANKRAPPVEPAAMTHSQKNGDHRNGRQQNHSYEADYIAGAASID